MMTVDEIRESLAEQQKRRDEREGRLPEDLRSPKCDITDGSTYSAWLLLHLIDEVRALREDLSSP